MKKKTDNRVSHINIEIPYELKKNLEMYCVMHDITMKKFISDVIQASIDVEIKGAKAQKEENV